MTSARVRGINSPWTMADGREEECPQTKNEQEREAERMANENLNLKMRVKHLEDMLGDRGDIEESMNIWDLRSALSRERERIVEEAAREVSERDELLARSRKTLEDLRAENSRLAAHVDVLGVEIEAKEKQLQENRNVEEDLMHRLETTEDELRRTVADLREVERQMELAHHAHKKELQITEQLLEDEKQRAQQQLREVRQEEQALLAKAQADMDAVQEELREMSGANDDFRNLLRQAERKLKDKEDEMRTAEANMREWAQREVREMQIREREVAAQTMEAEREKDLEWGREQVQHARQEERLLANQELQRLRDEMEALSEELVCERRERQEKTRTVDADLAAASRTVQQLEQRLAEETRRLLAAEEEVQQTHVRALNAEQSMRQCEADMQELRHKKQLAERSAEEARKGAQDASAKLEDMYRAQRDRERTLAEFQEEVRMREASQSNLINNLHKQLDSLKHDHAAKLSAAVAGAKEGNGAAGGIAEVELVRNLKSRLADCQQQLTEAHAATTRAEERQRALQKSADTEARKSSQAVRSAELARSALLEAEDALRREKETCGERMLQISSLQEHVERLERQLKDKRDEESEPSSTSVRSDARLMSAPPPTPFEKRDLAAALEAQRERAIEAEEELRLTKRRAREAESRVRELEDELRVQLERTKEAEADMRVMREKAVRDAKKQQAAAAEARAEGTRVSVDGQSRRLSGDGALEAERDKERLARALDKVQAKSKECARLQSEVRQLEEEAETLREGDKARVRLLQARNSELQDKEAELQSARSECSQLESEVCRLQGEVNALTEKQRDIEREADLAAQLLMSYEGNTDLSATALVKEALAHRDGNAMSATALVRDALAHHIKDLGSHAVGVRKVASLDLLRESLRSLKDTPSRHSPAHDSASASPNNQRCASSAREVDESGEPAVAGASAGAAQREGGKDAAIQSLSRENKELAAELEALQAKVGDLQGQLEAAISERQDLLDQTRKIEQAAHRDIDTNLRISISEANRRVAEVRTQLSAAIAERDEARRVTQDLKAMMGDVLQRQSSDTQQQHAQFHAENQRIKKEADEAARGLQQEIEALRRRSEALQAENAALLLWKDSVGSEKMREQDRERGKGAEMQKEADELQKSIADLRLERANLLKERQALLLRSERLALERENANAEIERLKGKVEELEGRHAAARDELTLHCNKFDNMLLQAREAWQRQLEEADRYSRQHQVHSVSASKEELHRERSELSENYERLRECNRLLILELEDTRERLLDERRRRHAAECTAVSASAAAQVAAAAAAAAAAAGNGGSGAANRGARQTSTAHVSTSTSCAKVVLPPVEDTPGKLSQPIRGACAAQDRDMTVSQFQMLLSGCVSKHSEGAAGSEEDVVQGTRQEGERQDAQRHSSSAVGQTCHADEACGVGEDVFASPTAHPSLPLWGQVARATAPHPLPSSRLRSRTCSPSPEPQWYEPAGLQASHARVKRRDIAEASSPQQPHLADASVMNLSHAAVRHLSCAPEEEEAAASPQPAHADARGADVDAARDISVIGMSRSAMREVSVPRDEQAPPSSSWLQRFANHDAPRDAAEGYTEQQITPFGLSRQRANAKSASKAAGPPLAASSRARGDRRPLSTMSKSDINAYALRVV